MKKAEMRLNSENMAPSGQRILHQGLFTKKIATKNRTRIVNLSAFGQAIVLPVMAC